MKTNESRVARHSCPSCDSFYRFAGKKSCSDEWHDSIPESKPKLEPLEGVSKMELVNRVSDEELNLFIDWKLGQPITIDMNSIGSLIQEVRAQRYYLEFLHEEARKLARWAGSKKVTDLTQCGDAIAMAKEAFARSQQEAAKDAASETRWQERQGEDYGTY